MKSSDNLTETPNVPTFLKIWQIMELIGLFFSIPILFFAGILFTGDSYHVYDFVNHYILPAIVLFLIIKIIVARALFKSKKWALYFNLIQNIILCIIFVGVIILTIIAKAFPIFPILFLFLFMFIARANLKCLRHPLFQKISNKVNNNIS